MLPVQQGGEPRARALAVAGQADEPHAGHEHAVDVFGLDAPYDQYQASGDVLAMALLDRIG